MYENKKALNPAKSFTRSFVMLSLALIVAVGCFNYLINPYSLFNNPQIIGVNGAKPYLKPYLLKINQIKSRKQEALFLGSSRVALGLDPEFFEAMTGISSYNAGFPGAKMDEIHSLFKYALSNQPELKYVVLGLDFAGFDQTTPGTKDFPHASLQNSFPPHLGEHFKALFSYQALKASIATVLLNRTKHAVASYRENGQELYAHCKPSDNPILQMGELNFLSGIHHEFEISTKAVEQFADIVKICKERNITLKVYFNPYKTCYAILLHERGHEEKIEGLKHQLCSIHPIWDFTGYNEINDVPVFETIPETFAESGLFIDCSHYSPLLGSVILKTLHENQQNFLGFGFLLSSDSFKSFIEHEKTGQKEWMHKNANQVEKFRKYLSKS